VNNPTSLHKSYTKLCTKGERVGEGGGEELYISTVNPLIGHACPYVVELHVVVLG
jgi:hypothetical protein